MPQNLTWFRLYHEARVDRKLALLTDAEHRVWFDLMCYAFERTGRAMRIENEHADDRINLAIEVSRGDVELLEAVLSRLVTLKILSVTPGLIVFINGQARQYDKPSDAPEATAARQAKSRQSKKPSRNVTPSHAVSPLEESREEKKDQGQNTCPKTPVSDDLEGFIRWWAIYPRQKAKRAAERAYRAALKRASADAIVTGLRAYRFSPDPAFIPHPATWLNGDCWADEAPAAAPPPSTPYVRYGEPTPGELAESSARGMLNLGPPPYDDWTPWEHTDEENDAHRIAMGKQPLPRVRP